MAESIKFCSFYVRFAPLEGFWWREVFNYVRRGFWQDIYTYWHRARHGWAPRDVWSFDYYLARVLSGGLGHLARQHNGTPMGFPDRGEVTDHDAWEEALNQWANAYQDYLTEDYKPGWPEREQARLKAVEMATKELAEWFGGLWD